MKSYYNLLFKRRSIRRFDPSLSVSKEELALINQKIESLIPLNSDIKTAFKIVKSEETTAKFGEYCIMAYSGEHPMKLLNIGYMLEQLDLFFVSINIGACWYGMAKTKEKMLDGLVYVIMIAFGKVTEVSYRTSSGEFNRKNITELWQGDFNQDIKNAAILAPSACNSQPWRIESTESQLSIYRKKSVRTIMTPRIRAYFNMIDMGIFLCFIDVLFDYYQIKYQKEFPSTFESSSDLVKIATYRVNN
jgi:nitroreductase